MAYDEHHDDHDEYAAHEGGLYASVSATGPDESARHRRRLVASTAVAVVAFVAAGFLAIQLMNEQQPSLPEPEALAPQTAPATASSTPEETAPVSRTPGMMHAAPVELSPVPSVEASRQASPDSAEARASAAIDDLRDRLRVSGRTRSQEIAYQDGTMLVVGSWRDATGDPLLRRARNAGTPAGNGIRCTTEVGNDPDLNLGRPPTLMCWRTSASRSVIVVSSASSAGREAVTDSARLIETEWPKLE
ncbi:hypothetical protein [Actinoplanes sp. NPDC026670]|uniref:hypothetical protein n=1 Tax=Actinoplanes sp. NPDC026670 TaxID=3154700 RepID=UPI0033C4EEDC